MKGRETEAENERETKRKIRGQWRVGGQKNKWTGHEGTGEVTERESEER